VYRLSRFLAFVAMTSAIAAVSVTHLGFPPIDYEPMVVVSSVAVVLAIGAATLSLILVGALWLRRIKPRPTRVIATSMLALALAFTYVWTL